MMQFLKTNKTLLLFGILAILGTYAYFNFFSGDTGPVVVTSTNATSPVSQELLLILTNLQTIKLNEAIFTDPAFLSLSDFGVQIPKELVGRRNPFAPVGTK